MGMTSNKKNIGIMLNNYFKKTYFKPSHSNCSLQMNMTIDDEMALSEHIEEFSQRLVFCLVFLLFATILCFADVLFVIN